LIDLNLYSSRRNGCDRVPTKQVLQTLTVRTHDSVPCHYTPSHAYTTVFTTVLTTFQHATQPHDTANDPRSGQHTDCSSV